MNKTKKAQLALTLGATLRGYRRAKGISVETVAGRLKVSRQLVTYWEGGAKGKNKNPRIIPTPQLIDYCRIIDRAPGEILDGAVKAIGG